MIIFRCKMCGGDLHPVGDATTCECEYCGSVQTIPTADNEKKLNLFARAQRLLRACEFDKAAGVYESIVAEFPEEAEAYWGLVLCKYGIEYVDDPGTGKKVPTCHRSGFEDVLHDPDFEQACENADASARRVYRAEARAIEALRKSIIEVSGKEAPYDIFICYKETDENGERTLDSVLSQDLYEALTEKGYRVFFARVTLEDKLGQAYEPYIFAALNSARVMLAVGTDYEHFNAVWVKNEWSRFLKLIARGEKKTLIPCYKGIDAYDMPEEFARLQAQDLGKVGATQDLLRGIEKIIPRKSAEQAAPAQAVREATQTGGPTLESLLKRAQDYLEDGAWDSARQYADRVLDIDIESAQAHLIKLLASLNLRKAEQLKTLGRSFEKLPEYKKVFQHADDAMRSLLDECVAANARLIATNEAREKRVAEARAASERERIWHLAEIRGNALECGRLIRMEGNQNFLYIASDQTLRQCRIDNNGVWRDTTGDLYERFKHVRYWKNLMAVVAIGGNHEDIAALREDGTVVVDSSEPEGPGSVYRTYRCDTGSWSDIVSICTCDYNIIGLRSNGTLASTGEDNFRYISQIRDVVGLYSGGRYRTADGSIYNLQKDAVHLCCEPEEHVVQCDGVLLTEDGSLIRIGPFGEKSEPQGQDIAYATEGVMEMAAIDINHAANGYITLRNHKGKYSFSWEDVLYVARSMGLIIGIKTDGTVLYCSQKNDGMQGVIPGLKLFDSFANLQEERREVRQAAMAAAETVFHQAQEKMGSLKDDLSRAEAEMAQLKGLFNIRRRREQAEVVDSTRANVEAQQKILDELEHDYKSWNEGKGAV